MEPLERYENLQGDDLTWMASGVAARAYLVKGRNLHLVPGDAFVRICVAAHRMHGALAAAKTAVAFKDVHDAVSDRRGARRMSAEGFLNLLSAALPGIAKDAEIELILQACDDEFARLDPSTP